MTEMKDESSFTAKEIEEQSACITVKDWADGKHNTEADRSEEERAQLL